MSKIQAEMGCGGENMKEISEVVEQASLELAKQTEEYLMVMLNAKKGDIKTKEDLKKFSFKCPRCKKTRNASRATLLLKKQPLELQNPTFELKQSIILICNTCLKKLEK